MATYLLMYQATYGVFSLNYRRYELKLVKTANVTACRYKKWRGQDTKHHNYNSTFKFLLKTFL